MGLDATAGDFAENSTTLGTDLYTPQIGAHPGIGPTWLEITLIGNECHTRCANCSQVGDGVMPKELIYA